MVNGVSGSYNRISGLASGLDTENLVKGLTSTQKGRVTAAEQQKQLLLWTRDSYRDVMKQLSDFRTKYLGTNNPLSNLKMYSAANSAEQYVKVTPGPNAKEGNVVINDIISLASAAKFESSASISKQATIGVDLSKTANLSGKSINVVVDGVLRKITFATKDYNTIASVQTELQNQLNTAFGANNVIVSLNDNTLILKSPGNTVGLTRTGVIGSDAYDVLSFTSGITNRINITAPLNTSTLETPVSGTLKFTINDIPFEFSSNLALSDIMKNINASEAGVTMTYSSITDKIMLTSKETGAGVNINVSDKQGNLMSSLFGAGSFTEGTNAQFKMSTGGQAGDPDSITYTTITKSSNSFDLDGVSYTLLSKASGTAEENANITVKYDSAKAFETIKSFVNDYNTMLKTVTDKLAETRYRDFPPLTDDQKEKLSETDQKKWEEKSKSGLLRNDITLTSIASELRKALYSSVNKIGDPNSNIGIILPDIGITTGAYSDKGQLKIDENKLKTALEERPNDVIKLFTQNSRYTYSPYLTEASKKIRYSESGIFNKVSDIIEGAIRNGGSLYKLIGSTDTDYSSIYSKRIRDIDKRINTLNEKLTADENRYFTQFSQMESAISKLNSTGSWLSSQLGS